MTAPRGIADRTVQSAGWMLGRRVSTNVVRIAAVAVLARHLSPAEFGVVALAQVLLQFVTLVGEAGIGTYVIYDDREGREGRVQAAFWLNLALTLAQSALCLALLPVVGHLFHVGRIASVLGALVAVFFIRQLAIVPEALLLRRLDHRVLARRDIVVDAASATLSVVLAVKGAGVWSLVVPALVLEPARLAIAFATAQWRPALPLRLREWRPVLRYTLPLMGSNVLIPVTNDGDTLLVGRLLGAATVGYYNVAWQLSNLIGRNVTTVVSSVTMPALALLRDDMDRLRAAYLRMVGFLALVCLPLLAGMAAVSGDLVPTLYGPRWEPAVGLLRVFVVFTLVRSLTSPSSMVYNVTGRPDIGFRFTLWFTPVYVAAILVGSHWDAIGIASGVMVARTGGAVVDTWLAVNQIDLRLSDVAAVVARSAAVTVAMVVVVWLARQAMAGAGMGPASRLVLATIVGAVVYGVGVAVVRPAGTDDLVRSLRSARSAVGRRRRPGAAAPEPEPEPA